MKVGDKLFVYGTLRPPRVQHGPGSNANRMMDGEAKYIGPDKINGAIYHLGGFPGIKLDDTEGEVVGDVYEIVEPTLPPRLDRYEGYPELYTREVVKTFEGREAWVYVYNGRVDRMYRIPSGDWRDA